MKVHIDKPYYSAGRKYGWGDEIPGIGVKRSYVDACIMLHKKLTVQVGKDKTLYEVSPRSILNAVDKYKSKYIARYDVELWVFPQNLLKKI